MLTLILMMPLAHARAVLSNPAVAQRDCCKQKPEACCRGSAKACCATPTPATPSLLPSQDVAPSLLPPRTVPVVHTNLIDNLTVPYAATRLPAQYSPPGLNLVGTTLLRI